MNENDIPILTDAIGKTAGKSKASDDEIDVTALRREIVNASHELLDERLREVAADLQSMLNNELVVAMKSELPGLIDRILTRHLKNQPATLQKDQDD
jgi:hypothetical protein